MNATTFDIFCESPAVRSLLLRVENGGSSSLSGTGGAAQTALAAALKRLLPTRDVIVVTGGLKAQEVVLQDAQTWLAQGPEGKPLAAPLFFPSWEVLPQEDKLPHADVISERLETLLATGMPGGSAARPGRLVIASVQALCQRTFTPATLRAQTKRIARGDRVDPLDLVEWLEDLGYEPEVQVSQKGEIALRGGIVDLFPATSPWPVRIEFFGDEVESLREFDPLTQISRQEIAEVVIPPGGELGLLRREMKRAATSGDGAKAEFGTLLDFLPRGAAFLFFEPELIEENAALYTEQVEANHPLHADWAGLRDSLIGKGFVRVVLREAEAEEADAQAGIPGLEAFRPIPDRAPEAQVAEALRREFFTQMHRWLRQGLRLHVYCNNGGEEERFREVWNDFGLATGGAEAGQGVVTRLGALSRGFLDEAGKLVVVTDAEVFGRYKIQRPRRLKQLHASATKSLLDIDFSDISTGDLVVHLQHGVGRYAGLTVLPTTIRRGTRPVESQSGEECLVIEYAPTQPGQPPPKLYVPVTESHLVSKYVGAGRARPPLNTLGGNRWSKAKEETERAVRDLAGELLNIQAARESQSGHSFGVDTHWQREFESSFLYEETPDQVKAIDAVKEDLERAKPMDRLICGDVGYGKTEVAIRAAFKAVMGGKQVAILVPTTVLAQQHFNTFRERMSDYPVRIELLSRFRTKREQGKVVRDLAAGAVDIVIGTHRLVQPDIAFKDLGLVVIDEEQRFGVLHKERFKRMRKLVDVLTLSATPIPRTLYLALTGARDMSTIETPPQDRLPVETIVAQYDDRLVRDAIQRELNRQGQVFYLHNRVTTIDVVAKRISQLVPRARILVGHGQMIADELEEVMTRFVNGEADVLVCTTIIESGIDIPNANTIIIDRADRFGLSELYQLRGRVGRYKHQAHALILLPRHAMLLTDARKRISALKQYSSLGSGFKIAMRDLEIRGAGNLLGPEQSGHITAVGFDLYCQLLRQSVAALKGEKVAPRVAVQVRIDFLEMTAAAPAMKTVDNPDGVSAEEDSGNLAAIPFNYVGDSRLRIEIYRKLAQAIELGELRAVEAESRDRFGPPPAPFTRLLAVHELKILAAQRGITELEIKEDRVMLTRHGGFVTLGGKFPRLVKKQALARLKEIRKLLLAI